MFSLVNKHGGSNKKLLVTSHCDGFDFDWILSRTNIGIYRKSIFNLKIIGIWLLVHITQHWLKLDKNSDLIYIVIHIVIDWYEKTYPDRIFFPCRPALYSVLAKFIRQANPAFMKPNKLWSLLFSANMLYASREYVNPFCNVTG